MTDTKLRVFGWTAVSTADQAKSDKSSLSVQRQKIEAWAESVGATVVHIAEVAGHSRKFRSLEEMATSFKKDGVTALDELFAGLERDEFDIFVLAESDRLARELAPFVQLINRIIDAGKQIYSIPDGQMINEEESGMFFGAIRGLYAHLAVSQMQRRAKMGRENRVNRGLPANGQTPVSHKLIKDKAAPLGARVIFDESQRRMWDDIASLILDGISWLKIGDELFNKYGHVSPLDNRPWRNTHLYSTVHNAAFWGHTAYYVYQRNMVDPWVWDDTLDAPTEVIMVRNTHQPVYEGETAQKIKDELRRRSVWVRGRAGLRHMHSFTGLFVCDYCGGRLTVNPAKYKDRVIIYWRCRRRANRRNFPDLADCQMRHSLNDVDAQIWIDRWLRKILAADDIAPLMGDKDLDMGNITKRLASIRSELAVARAEIGQYIRLQATATEQAQAYYNEPIQVLAEKISILERQIVDLEQPLRVSSAENASRAQGVADIKRIGIDAFWQQPAIKINQQLSALLGTSRIIVRDDAVVAVARVIG